MRIVTCSNCTRRFSRGTSQVFHKILFLFCADCWTYFREECHHFMQHA